MIDQTGVPLDSVFAVSSEPNVGEPTAASHTDGYFVAYRRGAGTVSARAQLVGADGSVVDSEASQRLSADTIGIGDLEAVSARGGHFVAWRDERHRISSPPYGASAGVLRIRGLLPLI